MDKRTSTSLMRFAILFGLTCVLASTSYAGGLGGAVKSITKPFNEAAGYSKSFNDAASRGYPYPGTGTYGTPAPGLHLQGGPSTNAPSQVSNGLTNPSGPSY